jgi:hypothetical protein
MQCPGSACLLSLCVCYYLYDINVYATISMEKIVWVKCFGANLFAAGSTKRISGDCVKLVIALANRNSTQQNDTPRFEGTFLTSLVPFINLELRLHVRFRRVILQCDLALRLCIQPAYLGSQKC